MWRELLLLVATAGAGYAYVSRGFLVTTPKVLTAGTTERVCVTFFGLRIRTNFALYLLPKENSTTSDSLLSFSRTFSLTSAPFENFCVDIAIPKKITVTRAYIRVTISSRINSFSSTKTSEVAIKPFTLVTLVQTDKFKYKPGQLVQFRVVTLKHDLTALDEVIDQIFVTTPTSTRLVQFDKVATKTGLVQQSFRLTEEPPLGTWTIHVKRGDRIVQQKFEVEEFVLPRFEVTLEAPKFVLRTANTATIKVCAVYTFGKPVASADVSLYVSSSLNRFVLARVERRGGEVRSNITLTDTTGKDGCVEIFVLLSKIGLGRSATRFNIYVSSLQVKANVTEAGTGITQDAETRIPVQRPRFNIKIDRETAPQFIKPNLDFIGVATVSRSDGKPASGELVEVCYTATYKGKSELDNVTTPVLSSVGAVRLASPAFASLPIILPPPGPNRPSSRECREYRSDDNGRIQYLIPAPGPTAVTVSVNLRTKSSTLSAGYASQFFRVWFSPTNSFIIIDPKGVRDEYNCSGSLTLSVVSTPKLPLLRIIYIVMARGQIVQEGVVTNGQITINLGFPLSPLFKVLVYYINALGEIVTDSRAIRVDKCLQNEVKVSWDKKQVRPGEQAIFTVEGAPNSFCGISAVDRSAELLGDANKLTAERVFRELDQFIIRQFASPRLVESPEKYCKRPRLSAVRAVAGPRRADVEEAQSRLVRMLQRERQQAAVRPAPGVPAPVARRIEPDVRTFFVVERQDAIQAFEVAGYLPITNLVLETRPCEKRNSTFGGCPPFCVVPFGRPAGGGGGPVFAVAARAQGAVAEDGRVADGAEASVQPSPSEPAQLEAAVRSFFPETFLFQLETLGSQGKLTLTRTLPDTITRWVADAICTNLQAGFGISKTASITTFKPFFAEINVPYSVKRGEVLQLKVSIFNFLSDDISVDIVLAPSSDFALESGAVVPTSPICVRADRPSVVTFPLTFTALGEVKIQISVRTTGAACGTPTSLNARDALVRTLLVKPEGFPQEDVSTAFLCREAPSAPATVEMFQLPLPNSLVQGSERVWVSVVGDLLTPSLSNIERLIRVPYGCGEQNMITFVPNIYARRYLETVNLITETLRSRTTNNMRSGYQRELRYRHPDGSYSAFGARTKGEEGSLWLTAFVVRSYFAASSYIAVDSKDLDISVRWLVSKQRSGNGCFPRVGRLFHKEMKGGVERGGEVALTAYVLLALLEVGGQTAAVESGLRCLTAGPFPTLYTEILVAHTFVMAGKRVEGVRRVTAILAKGIRRGGELHWEGDRSGLYGGSVSTDIEMTSYMVLTLLKLGGTQNLGEATLAIKWVNRQRNSVGGFRSTQDTIVALAALTEFAIATFSPRLDVKVLATTTSGFSKPFTVTPDTRLLTLQEKVSPLSLPTKVTFSVTGEGCALVQAAFRYNTRLPFPDPKFNLTVTTALKRPPSCLFFNIRICASFKQANAESNMAIIEVEMISGYVSVDSTLNKLSNSRAIKRWEFTSGKVVLYFDKFTTKEVCVEFTVIQETVVEKLKPATVLIYDYYATEDRLETEYTVPDCKA